MKDRLTRPMWHTKIAFFREMQFFSHCYTVVSYQALFRLSVYKIPAVYLSGAKNAIRDFGSPTNVCQPYLKYSDPLPETHLFFIWPHHLLAYLLLKSILALLQTI